MVRYELHDTSCSGVCVTRMILAGQANHADLGLSAHDDSLMQFGLDQWILEKSALFDKEQNLWRHINQQDNGFWATGNGWALLGLMRLVSA